MIFVSRLLTACQDQAGTNNALAVLPTNLTDPTLITTLNMPGASTQSIETPTLQIELNQPTVAPAAVSSVDITPELIGQVSIDRAMTDLRRITGEESICIDNGCYTIVHRETGSEGLLWAKSYIYEELVNLGYTVELQNWSREGYQDQNLIARKQGAISPDEEIYFVAHMDGVNPDEGVHSPAADDDGTGTVALLELARILSNHSFNRTLVLLFSTGEEQGILGVESYIKKLSSENLNKIKYVINVEMLGYDADQDGGMQLWSGDPVPAQELAQTMSEIIGEYQIHLVPHPMPGCV